MFVYKDNDNKDRSSQKYGGDGGNYQKVIKLAHNESVVGIRGTYGEIYGQTVITSISFLTPYSIYGPFGKNQGTKFSTCRPRTKVTEFFGRHGLFLDSIGVGFPLNDTAGDGGKQVVPIPRLPTMKDEPFGGPGGVYPWEFKFVDEICEIHIWSSNCVYSIMFVYKDHDNKDRSSKRYGGNGGNLEKVILPPNERVIAINGTSGLFHGNMVIMSISFTTPRRTHGPYGAKGGIEFSITRPEVKFAEFYGRYGQYLHSIGAAYYINDTQRNGVGGELGENIPRLPTAKDGPFGGTNGFIPWEFKFVEEIREIHIKSGSCIDSLMFVYRDNDHKDSNSLQFGSQKKMVNVQKVTLAQNEHIIGISGTFGPYYGNIVITSISFETSKQTYGPYGKTQGTSFATSRRRAKLTEFYGRHGPYLDSIGAVFLMNGIGQDAKEEPSKDDINRDGQLLDTKFVDKNLATGQDAKEDGPSKGEINRDGQLWDLKFVGEIREIYVRSANLRKVTE